MPNQITDCDTRTGQRVYPPPPADEMSDLLPEQQPPEQPSVSPVSGDDDSPNVGITCNPHLGQATTISREQHNVWFTVLLERPVNDPALEGWEEPQVCVWHNHNDPHQWEELKLKPTSGNDQTLTINHSSRGASRRKTAKTWFAAELSGLPKHAHAVSFTLKWRIGPSGDWNWIKDSQGISDGSLLYRACASVDVTKHGSYELGHFFEDISPDIHIASAEPECADTLLYSLTCSAKESKGEDSGYTHHRLGKPKKCSRWFALVRLWSPWLAPRHGDGDTFELDKEGVLLSFLRTDGMHVVCLAISGLEDVLATFIHGDSGEVEIKGRNDKEEEGTIRILVAVAESFEVANAAAMYHARKVVAEYDSSGSEIEAVLKETGNLDISNAAGISSTADFKASSAGQSPYQDMLSDHSRNSGSPPPIYQIVHERRGARTAWSATVRVIGQTFPARFWYDGQYVNNAQEDAAQVALQRLGQMQAPRSAALAASAEQQQDGRVGTDWLEEWYDGLSYCTWNGLGQGLTAQRILDALEDLSKNEINITNLIIDDNWQSLSTGDSQFKRGWSDFEANQSGFPDGLQGLTKSIREKYPNVEHIAVWHAILGYWGGIDADGNIAAKYKTIQVEKEPGVAGGTFTVVAPEDAKRLYDDFYSFLKNSGIDAAKTDAQFFLDMLLHAPDRRKMITEYQDAWTIAHLRHFSSRAISCMSQFPQAIFHSQLPQNRPRLLVRNSDDFFPEVEASHAWHIFCNAHNSLLNQHLNALPDWDMFQTSHAWAAFHAAARCVSGGPIYITDKPGEHDLDLIGRMCAQTVQGKTVLLRPGNVGKTVEPYNSYDGLALLKVGTYVGMKGTGSGILGVFNVSKEMFREFVKLDEFPGTEEGEYIIGSFRLEEVSKPIKRGDDNAFIGVEMGARGWDILTAYAAHSFTIRHSEQPVKVAVMGLLGKMTGSAATRLTDMYLEANGRLHIWVSLKALGVLGIWVSDLEERTVEGNFMVMVYDKPVPVHCVRKSSTTGAGDGRGGVLEIDLATAWKENKEEAGWSNQAEVDIYIS